MATDMPTLPPEARVTEITFTPPVLADDDERHHWSLTVEDTGRGWAVRERGMFAYDANGEKDPEPIPSERDEEHFARYRHTLPDALALAARLLPTLRINGMTAAEVADWKAAMRAKQAEVEVVLAGAPGRWEVIPDRRAGQVWVWLDAPAVDAVVNTLGVAGYAVWESDVSHLRVEPEPGEPPRVRLAVVKRHPGPTFTTGGDR
jgi:hypothetical protein